MSKTTAHPLFIAAIAVAFLLMAGTAQEVGPAPIQAGGPAPSPGLDCFPYLINMSDCLSYVQNGSNLAKPDKPCCPELANLVNTQPICLCQLLGHTDQVGFPIDINRALNLPSVCDVTTPPVSMCATIGIPVGALGPSGQAPSPVMTVPTGVPSASGSPPEDVGGPVGIRSPDGAPPTGNPSTDGSFLPVSTDDERSAASLGSNHHFLFGLLSLFLTYFF